MDAGSTPARSSLTTWRFDIKHETIEGDCLKVLKTIPDQTFDLTFTSPPYEAQRTYGIGFNLQGQEYVDWAVERFLECLRVTKGLVAWVVEGKTRQFRYSATPALIMADLHRAGVHLRKPPVFHRVGIPGSGGPDWLRNDWEWIICATSGGKLPWSDNTAMGKPCKYRVGGAMSHRTTSGGRVEHDRGYQPPKKANPGNVIHCPVGGGRMGNPICHANEAPFPEALAEFFIRSFCPPGGSVLDPFVGSGTTLDVAKTYGRNGTGIDIRPCQLDLCTKRLRAVS